jgi:methionyl-tRNA formyltransferase
LKVFRAQEVGVEGDPGRIVEVTKDGFVVATAKGGFRPLEVAPAGRKRMSATEFANGYRPQLGDIVG